jgi:hypothetical protein
MNPAATAAAPAVAGLLIALVLACFALLPRAQAVVPAPDGGYPGWNTAEGTNALLSLTTGIYNTALGGQALGRNTGGSNNTAVGLNALYYNNGSDNTANGFEALFNNTTGPRNTAVGSGALIDNAAGSNNTAIGYQALSNSRGDNNTALGRLAGANITTGSGNIAIGYNVQGTNANNTTWIGNVYGNAVNGGAVYVDSNNKFGTLGSSRRYKDEIRPVAKASEVILSLQPVSFRYKKEIDPTRSLSFGLIAEEVAQVDPHLVTLDRDGKPQAVRYEAVNAMLLNEFLKAHRKIQEQEATINQLKKGMEVFAATLQEQASQIQKVSAERELNKPAPRTVVENR